MVKTILFDLDGTLTDPALGITNSVMYALEQMGRPVPPREELLCFIGPPLVYGFSHYTGMTQEEAEEATRLYRVYFSEKGLLENRVFDGIPEALQKLKNRGYRLVIATSKPEVYSRRILEHFGLMQYFDALAGATMDHTRNTKDKVIAYGLQEFHIDPATAIMVGDREHDMLGARDNGLPALGVTFGYGARQELMDSGAKYIADSVEEMTDILLSL